MARISEDPCPADTLENIRACATDALDTLELVSAPSEPREAISGVNEFIRRWHKENRPGEGSEDFEDSRLCMAALWGEQLAATFGWQWAWVTFHDFDDSRALGVFSANRSLAIYPFEFLLGCMRNPDVPVTILLAFNMLSAGKIPDYPANSFVNVMDHVHHIIPPE